MSLYLACAQHHELRMQYKATLSITLRPSILDPQGKATLHALHNLGFDAVERVRVGKLIEMWLEAQSQEEAAEHAMGACQRLLANAVMEDYEITVEEAVEAV